MTSRRNSPPCYTAFTPFTTRSVARGNTVSGNVLTAHHSGNSRKANGTSSAPAPGAPARRTGIALGLNFLSFFPYATTYSKVGLAMMMQGVVFAVVVLLFSGCALGPLADISSNWVEVNYWRSIHWRSIHEQPGGKRELVLTVRNKSERTLWVKVRFAAPSPNPECVLSKKLEPGEQTYYPCGQEKLVAYTDYPIFVSVYLNEGLTDQAESAQTKMRFSKRGTDSFERSLPMFPVTFKGIISAKEPGIGTTLFSPLVSLFADDSGTLVVRQDSIDYTSKDKMFAIPVSQVRSVNIKDPNTQRAWAVVEYAEPDGNKVIAFQMKPFNRGILNHIESAIRYVVMKSPKGTQDK